MPSSAGDRIRIEVQDAGGWSFIATCQNLAPDIRMAMLSAQRAYPEKRVRAVDDDGRIVDIL